MPEFTSPQGRRIAYDQLPGEGPGIVFLGGFRSDKEGTKAVFLEEWAKKQGRAFLRFDYSGHGSSGGVFEEGAIGDWAEDAAAALSLTQGPQVLVGSSMGGWISLLLARAVPEKVAGLVTIAAAPDFTEDGFWAGMTRDMRTRFEIEGYLDHPSEYGDPLRITRRLIEEGRGNLVLRSPLALPFPVRFLQGTADEDVSVATALRLLEHAEGPDMRLTLVDGADHRFSTPDCLDLIAASVAEVSARV
ncbi:alpha/beta hydrolase [uncultured Limimaricola sp.]|uniref:alpha/beta hydrolase n=1 Tax=uncultured Limimaricola sp. TaxID=2211667 RepID=UPI0030F4FE04